VLAAHLRGARRELESRRIALACPIKVCNDLRRKEPLVNRLLTATFAVLLLCLSFAAQEQASAQAQPPAPGASRPAPAPLAIPNPHYVSIEMEIDVDRPAADVWKRVGKFCDIGEWFQFSCTILSGTDGELGVVRSIGNEVMVGKTELSYTYTQPVREGQPYNLYHGTLEARPVTATTSKLVYTLVFDNSMLADDAARDADIANRKTRFMNALKNMKILAEGGTLPPRPAPAPR
jgi:Polyketide cyclase / dehydrase and lipid transport